MPRTLLESAAELPGRGQHFVYWLYARKPEIDPEECVVLVYIGVTSNLRQRLRAHGRKWWAAAIDFDLCFFEEWPTRAAADQEERRALRVEEPQLNIDGRPRLVQS